MGPDYAEESLRHYLGSLLENGCVAVWWRSLGWEMHFEDKVTFCKLKMNSFLNIRFFFNSHESKLRVFRLLILY